MGENGNLGKKYLLLVVNGVNSGRRSSGVWLTPRFAIRSSGGRKKEKEKKEEGGRRRKKKKEGRRRKEEGRRRKFFSLLLLLLLSCQREYTLPFHAPPRPCQCCNAESIVIEVYKKAMMGKLKAKTGEHL